MMFGVGYGRTMALACALFALACSFDGRALAAPRASDLGTEVAMAEPSGGFVGRLEVTPLNGPVGTPLTVTGDRLPSRAGVRSCLANCEGQLEGHDRRISWPRIHAGRLSHRDGEER